VVTTAAGGTMGGGTTVTPVGEKTIALYHSIEAHTRTAARSGVQALRK
jgi:molybdate transport repressor ModE-like protein